MKFRTILGAFLLTGILCAQTPEYGPEKGTLVIQGGAVRAGEDGRPALVMTHEPQPQHGFECLRRTAIDQHINTRNRWDDIIPVIPAIPRVDVLIDRGSAKERETVLDQHINTRNR